MKGKEKGKGKGRKETKIWKEGGKEERKLNFSGRSSKGPAPGTKALAAN
jgi:hypothetical protein